MDKQAFSQRKLVTIGIITAAVVLFFALNIFAGNQFKAKRIDLTERKLFTLSNGTKNILSQIGEPITLKFYYSKKLATGLASLDSYAKQVREVLTEYQRLSNGKIVLQEIDPVPFSEDEDMALGYGLHGVPMDEAGSAFYFGLVGTNSTDTENHIAFFQEDREAYLEYDITQMVYQLLHPKKPTLGVMTSLPIMGNSHDLFGHGHVHNQVEPWRIWSQLNALYDVQLLPTAGAVIPGNLDLLLVLSPEGLDEASLYAIDQYVLRGGHLLGFFDTFIETSLNSHAVKAEETAALNKLLKAWGVELAAGKVVADRQNSKKVWFSKDDRRQTVDYPFWFDVKKNGLNSDDIITGNLDLLTMTTPGYFEFTGGSSTRITKLVSSSEDATTFAADDVKAYQEDPASLNRTYQKDSKVYPIAVRIEGNAKSAFPYGQPGDDVRKSQAHLTASKQGINVVLVADVDLLYDKFWLRKQSFLGQQIVLPVASNGNLLFNAVDNLIGSSDLAAVRSRSAFARPFTTLQEIAKAAQVRYHDKEKILLERLKETEKRLQHLNDNAGDAESIILSAAQKLEIESFRQEHLAIRKQLREVQHELQRDIEDITTRIKVVNIALMPILVGVAGLAIAWLRIRNRRKRGGAC